MERQITLAEIVAAAVETLRNSVYHSMPGTVTAYDASHQTADVQPMVNDVRINLDTGARVSEPWQVIPAVPVIFPKFSGLTVYCDLAVGDAVELVAYDLDPTAYRSGGQRTDPADVSRHVGSYWRAFPGDIRTSGAMPGTAGTLVLGNPKGTLQNIALAPLLDSFIKVFLQNWTPVSGDGGAALKTALGVWATNNLYSTVGSSKVKASV